MSFRLFPRAPLISTCPRADDRRERGVWIVRSPRGETRRTEAFSAHRTGAVSLDCTAQQRSLDGATQQISPSHFMQKSTARRHSNDWS